MKSARRGAGTSQVEVSGISPHGIWLFLGDRETFLSFKEFPWFRDAPVAGVLNVKRPQPHHLYWPDLDVNLHLDSIDHPESSHGSAGCIRRRARKRAGQRSHSLGAANTI